MQGKWARKKGTQNTDWTLTGSKDRGEKSKTYTIFFFFEYFFIFKFHLSRHAECKYIDCGKSAWVYPCFHSRTPSTSAEGVGVGSLQHWAPPPCPHWAPARTDTSVPRTLLLTWARHPNTALNWGAQVILKIIPVIPIPFLPDHPPPPPQFVLIYLFRRIFEVEAFFYLLGFSSPPPWRLPMLPQIWMET